MKPRQRGVNSLPFERSYWVETGRLLAGYYLGALNRDEAESKIDSLLYSGIRCVINLVEEDEQGWDGKPLRPYQWLLSKMAVAKGIDVTYLRVPISDLSIPLKNTMKSILDTIDGALSSSMPVYVHCWGGRGHTGTVVGCYLARSGRSSGSDVMRYIAKLRRNEPTAHKVSPETDVQRAIVCSWLFAE